MLLVIVIAHTQGSPVARKAIVVAPATLVANWGKEVSKWLGSERLRFIQLPQGPEAAAKVW
jgi:DNA repair and recombination protein RAD54B